jgi:1-acyl-sn-glycerol-3-phosphate acyltransferase
MRQLKIGYRLILLSLVVSTGTVLTLLFQRGALPPRGIQSTITRWWHRNIARSLGVPVRVYGTPRNEATLFVSNHVSSFDIAALGSVLPVRFLSKIEVRHWPLLGWLATRAGTLYIPRGGRQAAANANKAIAEALEMKHNVLLFAEGTTSDGNVKRFHSRLMQSAVDSGVHVQPVAVRYPDPDGGMVHPAALYIDDISFIDSTRRMLVARQLEVEIYFGEAISAENKSRDELAKYTEAEVRRLLES